MKAILLFIFICLALISCGDKEELPAGRRADSFKLADNKQALIIEALKADGIEFVVDERGFINYMAKDISKVRKLERKVIYGDEINEYDSLSEAFSNPGLKDTFVEILKSNGIWHDVSTFKGTINVTYLLNDAGKVDEAYQDAYLIYYKR